MRTEMARVQTEAQMQSLKQNGFDEYQFLALGNACEICRAIDGKHFPVDKMMPGLNAPPMHPNCRCSTSAYMDRGEFDRWLDFLDQGGTTKRYKKLRSDPKTTAFTANKNGVILSSGRQLGHKFGEHARDYGIIPSNKTKSVFIAKIQSILENSDEMYKGHFRGQEGNVRFYIKGNDVVVTNNGEFVTLMKNGVENGWVKDARKQKI